MRVEIQIDGHGEALTVYETNQVREFLKAIDLVRRISVDRKPTYSSISASF